MPKTRKQRGGVAKMPLRYKYSVRREINRRRPVGLQRPRQESRFEFTRNNKRIIGPIRRNKNVTGINKQMTRNIANLVRNMEVKRDDTTYQYIKSVKSILEKLKSDLESEDNDLALAIATDISPLLGEIRSDLGLNMNNNNNNKSNMNFEDIEENIDELYDIVNDYLKKYKKALLKGDLRRIHRVEADLELIAVTLDRGIQEARAIHVPVKNKNHAPVENTNVNELAGMFSTFQPFRAA